MKKVILLILDGWGIGNKDRSDAIHNAKTPFVDSLYSEPNSVLKTFGENVGLPEGQMGNSEVGHMNIGAGRVVWQMLVRINKAFETNEIENLSNFQNILSLAREKNERKIHLMGLVSDGGVHSSLDHLKGLVRQFKKENLDDRVLIHAFMDGRDTDPKGGVNFIQSLENEDTLGEAKLASIVGRYYAMDRDKRWERTSEAYNLLVNGEGVSKTNGIEALKESYAKGVTDEFITPISLLEDGIIKEDDIVLCFNFRTDRGRQITHALTQQDFPDHKMKKLNLNYFTMTEYDKSFEGINVLFDNRDLENTLGEVLANHNKKQLRGAETEKYPHVTFFFNGGREEPFNGEDRLLVNSPKVATYDLQPEMSAFELTDGVLKAIKQNTYDFMCINFANPDMVGHTGDYNAIIKACETVDGCTKQIVEIAREEDYSLIVIADHGNADKAINEDGSPHTAHTTNLVPCFLVNSEYSHLNDGKLADIAPTVLTLMGLEKPAEMDGVSLI